MNCSISLSGHLQCFRIRTVLTLTMEYGSRLRQPETKTVFHRHQEAMATGTEIEQTPIHIRQGVATIENGIVHPTGIVGVTAVTDDETNRIAMIEEVVVEW